MFSEIFLAAALASASPAPGKPPIEAYGELPAIYSLALSPDGDRFAYLTRRDGRNYVGVATVGGDVIAFADAGDLKARNVTFLDEDYIVIRASETASQFGFRGKWEHSGAIGFDLKTKKAKLLLNGSDGLYPAQTGLGRIIGVDPSDDGIFMPAYVGAPGADPPYSLLKVTRSSGKGRLFKRGTSNTIDWLVDDKGEVLARIENDDKSSVFRIQLEKNGSLKTLYEEREAGFPDVDVVGVSPDGNSLVVWRFSDNADFDTLAKLSFKGEFSPPIFKRDDAEAETVFSDINRKVFGVQYSGLYPSYEFFDPARTKLMSRINSSFPNAAVRLVDWTPDFSKLVLFVDGGAESPAYFLFDEAKGNLSKIASEYPAIHDADVGAVSTIEYKARDGLKIPAIVTLPPGKKLGDKLPMIVIPHGGPEAYDAVGFDWLAQFFANRGYVVLQPNFRGSDGFGDSFRLAGYGEWGAKMQDDITDGVRLFIKHGFADPERICIIGASYGGYAALAGGAFTPELYKCVAAIAGVSDIPLFLRSEERDHPSDKDTKNYLKRLVGDRKSDKAKLEAISPVNAASSFAAPVLLIHGTDDTVVPFEHSTRMETALKRAGKDVELIKLKHEDHWLSVSETRLQTLKALDAFVAETIGKP